MTVQGRWGETWAAVRRNALRILEAFATPGRSSPGSAARTQTDDERTVHTRERVRQLWSASRPTETLTWGKLISGDAFVAAAERYGVFAPDHSILEIGPGYGRLRQRERVFIGGDVYVRRYRKQEVRGLLEDAGLDFVGFDEVVHTPRYRRLLVVAPKPSG